MAEPNPVFRWRTISLLPLALHLRVPKWITIPPLADGQLGRIYLLRRMVLHCHDLRLPDGAGAVRPQRRGNR